MFWALRGLMQQMLLCTGGRLENMLYPRKSWFLICFLFLFLCLSLCACTIFGRISLVTRGTPWRDQMKKVAELCSPPTFPPSKCLGSTVRTRVETKWNGSSKCAVVVPCLSRWNKGWFCSYIFWREKHRPNVNKVYKREERAIETRFVGRGTQLKCCSSSWMYIFLARIVTTYILRVIESWE